MINWLPFPLTHVTLHGLYEVISKILSKKAMFFNVETFDEILFLLSTCMENCCLIIVILVENSSEFLIQSIVFKILLTLYPMTAKLLHMHFI